MHGEDSPFEVCGRFRKQGREEQSGGGPPLSHAEDQQSVSFRRRMGSQHARVAIHFDGQAKPPSREPEREIPRHERDDDRRREEQVGIFRRAVLLLVPQHECAKWRVERQDPTRQHGVHRTKAHDRGTIVAGDAHRPPSLFARRVRGGAALITEYASRSENRALSAHQRSTSALSASWARSTPACAVASEAIVWPTVMVAIQIHRSGHRFADAMRSTARAATVSAALTNDAYAIHGAIIRCLRPKQRGPTTMLVEYCAQPTDSQLRM
jgi:hypothetical protein